MEKTQLKPLSAHELAHILLNGPDKPVYSWDGWAITASEAGSDPEDGNLYLTISEMDGGV